MSKKSLADCLQTRPIDYPGRYVRSRGKLNQQLIAQIDEALREDLISSVALAKG